MLKINVVHNRTLIEKKWVLLNEATASVIFTARCYASAVLAMGLCPCLSVSVFVSVCHKPVFY